MLNIFSCVCYPSVCLLWRNVHLGLLPIFWLAVYFFAFILSCMNCLYILKINPLPVVSFVIIFSHFEGFFFSLFVLFMLSFAVLKLLKFNSVSFVYFCFYFNYPRRWVKKDPGAMYVIECSAYVFLEQFHSVCPYIQVFNPFLVYFCLWCSGVF